MSEALALALLALLAGAFGTLIGYLVVLTSQNRQLWLWARRLIDFAYRHNPENHPLPAPPDFLARKEKP